MRRVFHEIAGRDKRKRKGEGRHRKEIKGIVNVAVVVESSYHISMLKEDEAK
jgi:hypothetical protein